VIVRRRPVNVIGIFFIKNSVSSDGSKLKISW